jgi:hypothetical protein
MAEARRLASGSLAASSLAPPAPGFGRLVRVGLSAAKPKLGALPAQHRLV